MSRPLRYTCILGLLALATGLAAIGGWRYARASAPVNGPIILISIDGLRTDRLAAYGARQSPAPSIDALAADGIVFERAYSHVPQTLPAHASILSGRLPFETGVRDNVGFAVKDDERLLAEMLDDRGFATAAVVSTYALRRETGIGQGFSLFDAGMAPALPDAAIGELRRAPEISEAVAERWLDGADTSRLFLFLQLQGPHAPYEGEGLSAGERSYDAQLAESDRAVGLLIRYLKAHQLYDRSTILLVSAYGQGLADHGELDSGLFVYDESVHVPLIVKQAAGEGAGRRVADVVQHVDVAPTILDFAKAPSAGRLSGRSLKPLLDGSGRFDRRMVYSESLYAHYHFGWNGLTSITDGRYRYIRAPREELYDLQSDPRQQRNIAADAAGAIIDPLRHDLKQFGAGIAVPEPAAMAREDRERLDALGFVGLGGAAGPVSMADGAPVDPKDRLNVVETYRSAVRLGVSRKWFDAIERLRQALGAAPDRTDLWRQLAVYSEKAGRPEQALAAYKRILTLRPDDVSTQLGAAGALLQLRRVEEARRLAARLTNENSIASTPDRFAAHVLLAEVALARRDAAAARAESALASGLDPKQPMTDYIEGRLLAAQGRLSEAIPFFENAVSGLERLHGAPIRGLHFYLGDTLSRLKRYADAEAEYLAELKTLPDDMRARVGLANAYHRTGRPEETAAAIADLTRISPIPEAYRLAAQFWESTGEARRAAGVRTEASRLFQAAPRTSPTAQ